MALNVCTAVIGSGCNTATATPSLAQWDVGQVLKIEGVDLPAAYQVEFSTEYTRNAIQKIGNADGVAVPNELLQRSAPITAYVVLHEGENDRETEYWITIHITPRTPPETITPDPEEQSVIDETIAALQDGVEAAQAAAESVQNMGVEAETLAAGSPASVEKTVDPETGEVTLSFGIPRGDQGNPGRPGTDGVTPDFQIGTVETLPPTSPATATITGTAEEPVLNLGIPQGQKGDPGGSGGTSDYTELDNKPQINGHTLNGDQSASDLGLGTYSKPGTGIPKTDLASDVQQSLGKADSALQSAPVSSVAGKTGAVQLNAGDIEFDDSATYATGSVGAEVSAQKNAIGELNRQLNDETTGLDTKAPVIINTASGAIASFDDGADSMPIKSLVASIEPVQDLHGYEYPWPGGGSKNLFNPQYFLDAGCVLENGYYKGSQSQIATALTAFNEDFTFEEDARYALSYTIRSDADVYLRFVFHYSDSTTSQSSPYSSTTDQRASAVSTAGKSVVSITRDYSNAGTVWIKDVQLEKSESVTDYIPYSNECPISGHTGLTVTRTGVNVWDEEWEVGNYSSADGSKTSSSSNIRSKNKISVVPGSTYYFKFPTNYGSYNGELFLYDDTQTFIRQVYCGGASFSNVTIPSDTHYITFSVRSEYGTTYNHDISINYPSTDTAYHAYTGTTIPITFPTTIYGGSDEVIGGALESTMGMVDLGTLNWSMNATGQFFAELPQESVVAPNGSTVICSMYKSGNAYASIDKSICVAGNAYRVWARDSDYSDAATFKASVSGAQLCYELASPIEYTLTANELNTLYGQNNVWTDVGDVSVDYPADTKLYIDNKITTAIANALNS